MSQWFPLHLHSHFSLLDGLSQNKHIVSRLKDCGYEGAALSDHGGISGFPAFNKAMQKAELKPIAANEFYVSNSDATIKSKENGTCHLVVLAKSQQGWRNLMKATSASYMPAVMYRKPRLDLERLASYSKGEFISFSGHIGSALSNIVFTDYRSAYNCRSYDEAKSFVRTDWKDAVTAEIRRHQSLFGPENFFLEIQLVDQANLPACLIVARILRDLGRKLNVPRVATADSHYARREDAGDQRIILCSALNTTMKEVERKLEQEEEVGLGGFFRSNNYHIPNLQEMVELHGDCPDELQNAVDIAKRCEVYQTGGKPILPSFPCPNGQSPDEYLKELCRQGWNAKVGKKVPKAKHEEYRSRLIDKELPVITKAGLSSYFLIVQDYIRYATEELKALVGRGRGSAAGCLVSYLTGITRVDPIAAKLSFERFYNDGRNTPGRVAFPDIDTDFEIGVREKVIEYVRRTYGEDKVAQMATFSRMQGRGALKDVFRARGSVSFDEMNLITEHIPDEAEISDQLQVMRDESETGEASIIQWALLHNPEPLKKWAFINDKGEMDGALATEFAQAIRLEGTKRSMGKHASGLIVSVEPLADTVPMVWDKSSEQMIVGVDMRDAEEMGLIKLDILGLRTLDAIAGAVRVARTGKLR